MHLYDSHAHINEDGFNEEQRAAFIEKIQAGINSGLLLYVNDIGYDLESSLLATKHAGKYPWCYAVVGCHPHGADDFDEEQYEMINALAKREKVVAIGEIGLDYHYDNSDRENQKYWFRRQIQLANQLHLPIVIHEREAAEDCMNILKEEGAFSEERKSWFPKRVVGTTAEGQPKLEADARVLLHCFSGSAEMGKQYVKLGATLSIAGPVTYKNARKTVEVAYDIPLVYLLIETDSPYLTPVPFRGQRNNPVNVEFVAEKIAEIKGIEALEVARATCKNAKIFFNIQGN